MSPPKIRAQYKALTYAEKFAVICEVDKGLKKKSQIAKEFGIPANTLSTFIKNRDKILGCVTKENSANRKRAREPENPDLDECVLKWFRQAQNRKIALTGSLIRAKAEQFATSLGKSDFKASSGWLSGFKDRNGISFKSVTKENEEGREVEEQHKNFEIYEISDAEILREVTLKKERNSSDKVKEIDELPEKPIPTVSEALSHLYEVRRFVRGQDDATISIFQALNSIQEFMTLQETTSVN